MKININGVVHDVQARTVAELLDELDQGRESVATAVDGIFVPREERGDRVLAVGCRVDIVAPIQGG